MYKIGELKAKGAHFVLYYDQNAIFNPYKIYNQYFLNGRKRRKLLQRYANLFSCTIYINDYVRCHDEEDRKYEN